MKSILFLLVLALNCFAQGVHQNTLTTSGSASVSFSDLSPELATTYQAASVNFPLDIPTFDGVLNATHPSVLDFGQYSTNWFGGHRYWMGFTPYPSNNRELPSIVFSDDGINWHVPGGLVNPVFTTPESHAINSSADWSDSEIFTNGGKMVLLGRISGGSDNAIAGSWWIKTSVDGTNWPGSPVRIWAAGTGTAPQVVDLGTGLRFYYQGNTWNYVESDYNYVFGNPVVTTGFAPWHFGVREYHGVYYAIGSTGSGGTSAGTSLIWGVSSDGITWTTLYNNVIARTGYAWDTVGYYKPCFNINSTSPTTNINLWVGSASPSQQTGQDEDHWRISLFRNIDIPFTTTLVRPFGSVGFDVLDFQRHVFYTPGSSTVNLPMHGATMVTVTLPSTSLTITVAGNSNQVNQVQVRQFWMTSLGQTAPVVSWPSTWKWLTPKPGDFGTNEFLLTISYFGTNILVKAEPTRNGF